MGWRRRTAGLVIALIVPACASDLFHSTEWTTECDRDPDARGCTGASATTGGSSGSTSAGGGGGGGSEVTAAAACAELAAEHCDATLRCLPVTYGGLFADDAACVPANRLDCEKSSFGPGSTFTPGDLLECLGALDLSRMSCEAFLRYAVGQSIPSVCRPPGTLPDGAPCVDRRQCQGGACPIAAGEACGACAEVQLTGGTCVASTDCAPGLRCAAGACAPLGEAGAACAATSECFADLACLGGVCGPRLPAGAACSAVEQECVAEHFCNTTTQVCEPWTVAPLGASCGLLAAGDFALCGAGTACEVPMTSAGACVAVVDEGEPCAFDGPYGSHCRSPARCIAGVCHVRDAADCGP